MMSLRYERSAVLNERDTLWPNLIASIGKFSGHICLTGLGVVGGQRERLELVGDAQIPSQGFRCWE